LFIPAGLRPVHQSKAFHFIQVIFKVIMENSSVSLITAEDGPHHLQLPTGSHSFLCPSSALLHQTSESSHLSHHYPPDKSEKGQDGVQANEKKRAFRSSLMENLRNRFPDGRPPQAYDDFIQVSLNDVPPDSDLVMDEETGAAEEHTRLSPVERLSRMTSRVFATISNSLASRPCKFFVYLDLDAFQSLTKRIPALPLLNQERPVISSPRPMESASGRKPRAALSPSPVQFYNRSFIGVGPPAPLPSPSDIIDIRPSSRNTTHSHGSNTHSAGSHARQQVVAEIPPPALPERAQLSTKNSIVFPTAREEKRKMVRIVTPRTNGASHAIPISTPYPFQQKTLVYFEFPTFIISLFSRLQVYISRILRFQDPAESLFLLGFFTGPQTWLLGGWYLTTTSAEPHDKKSQLRIWIDKHVEQTASTTPNRNMKRTDPLLERIEQASSHLTSSSFEVGRRTVTDSNTSRLRLDSGPPHRPTDAADPETNLNTASSSENISIMVLPTHFRSSRAVWSGSKTGIRERPHYEVDEISIDIQPSRWVYRCRVAALISGMVVMSSFLSALAVVCVR
jgi:hypothetical protein